MITASQGFSQVVKCVFSRCAINPILETPYCDYECEDGVNRSVHGVTNQPNQYACKGSKNLFVLKPNCKDVLAKEKAEKERTQREIDAWKKQQQQENEKREKELQKDSDKYSAKNLAERLFTAANRYIDILNDYLVNGDKPTIENLGITADILKSANGKEDAGILALRNPKKGYGIEIYLTAQLTKGSCTQKMTATLEVTLKKGFQDIVEDECDFWNTCKKKDGFEIDNVSWNVPAVSNCATDLKTFLNEKTLDTRKKLK